MMEVKVITALEGLNDVLIYTPSVLAGGEDDDIYKLPLYLLLPERTCSICEKFSSCWFWFCYVLFAPKIVRSYFRQLM